MNRLRARNAIAADSEQGTRVYYYWLLLSLFLEYARPASYFSFLQVPFLYSAIPVSLFVASCFVRGLRPLRDVFADPLAKWVPIFITLIGISIFHADVSLYVFNIFKLVVGYGIIFIMVARIVTTEVRFRGVIATLLLAHLFLLAMNPNVVLEPDTRHYILGATFLGDGNDFSMSLCILIPAAIAVALGADTKWGRWVAWAGVTVALLAIVASQSRGAALGLGAVVIYLWLLSPRKMLALVGVALVGVVVLIYAPAVYFQRIGTISNYQTEGSAMGRITAWKAGARMAAANPVLGVGAGHFAVSFGTKYRPPEAQGMPWLTAHSSYFLVLGELGLPGIITFLILVFGNLRANGKLRRYIMARAGPGSDPKKTAGAIRLLVLTSAATLGFATAGAFLSAAYYPHIFVLTGLLIAVRSIAVELAGAKIHEALGRARNTPRTRSPRPAVPVADADREAADNRAAAARPALPRRPQS